MSELRRRTPHAHLHAVEAPRILIYAEPSVFSVRLTFRVDGKPVVVHGLPIAEPARVRPITFSSPVRIDDALVLDGCAFDLVFSADATLGNAAARSLASIQRPPLPEIRGTCLLIRRTETE